MNTLRLYSTFAVLSLATLACDSKDECIADCNAEAESDSNSGSDSRGDSESTGVPNNCEADALLADEFVTDNRACVSSLDCVELDSICYQGAEDGPCGLVAVSADADADAWNEIHDRLEDCELCVATPCGSSVMCTDAGQCESVLSSDDYCPSIERDIEAFIAENRSCSTVGDCVGAGNLCDIDLGAECSTVALNASADLDDWDQLTMAFDSCTPSCNLPLPKCDAVECSPEGQCITVL